MASSRHAERVVSPFGYDEYSLLAAHLIDKRPGIVDIKRPQSAPFLRTSLSAMPIAVGFDKQQWYAFTYDA
ncbi:hypothetical protein CXF80_06105 [Shewanella sp. Actino-trap-3]|nr:hypothetical protein CXF80_06105 [Shewanella sp. Actino-trap-3]